MKKALLIALFLVTPAVMADTVPKVNGFSDSKVVTKDRFVQTGMTGALDYIITDTKTGCQFAIVYNGGIIPLGCFSEFKK